MKTIQIHKCMQADLTNKNINYKLMNICKKYKEISEIGYAIYKFLNYIKTYVNNTNQLQHMKIYEIQVKLANGMTSNNNIYLQFPSMTSHSNHYKFWKSMTIYENH